MTFKVCRIKKVSFPSIRIFLNVLTILICIVTTNSAIADQYTCYPDDASLWTGRVYLADSVKTDGDVVTYRGTVSNKYRGWIKFNISAIPDNADILTVELNCWCTYAIGGNGVDVYSVESDPVTAPGIDLYDDCGDGSRYYNNWVCTPNQWNSALFGGGAHDSLEAHLADDWFAVGFTGNDTGDSIVFTGHGGTNRPFILVTCNLIGTGEKESCTTDPSLKVFPNPFRHRIDIRWPRTDDSPQMKIYDVSGQLVKNLSNHRSPFNHVSWYGTDDSGRRLPSGIYFLKFKIGERIETQKILLLR